MTTTTYSPLRSPASSRLQLGGASRLRSSSLKKPPEPLRRAVADSLSSSAPSHHGSPSSGASEASKILRDYLAAHATTDLAYNVILEHTLAEKERSPAVVGRCVGLLKRHLLRYKPSEETLLQIDRFCVNIIAECDIFSSRRSSVWSQSSNPLSGKTTSTSPLPVSSFASGPLVKSLNYVRSLVAQHMPRRSFQPAAFAGAPSSRQSLPTLSSLLSRSFNSQLTPANNSESSENKETATSSVSSMQIAGKVNRTDDLEFIAVDVLKWRWCRDQQSSSLSSERNSQSCSDNAPSPQDTSTHNFLEVGAAALLVGDMEYKSEGQPWRNFGTSDMPYLDQLLQPSLLTTVTSSASARAHLRAITAAKRTKTDPSKIWEESQVNTFRPRARPLFQYRPYSEQQPLRLNPVEVCEVIASVCTETPPPHANHMTVSSKLSNNSGKPSMDVAVSVLIKLVIDMYILDSGTAAPLTLSMLKEMLTSPKLTSRSRAFDLILNLGVHGHLLEPMILDDTTTIEEDYPQETYLSDEAQLAIQEKRLSDYSRKMEGGSLAINKFETWILGILYEILLHLVQIQEKDESVWASALSCLLYFVCDRGNIRRKKLEGLDIRVVKVLIEISRRNSWAEIVHSKLICMLTNMFYQVPDATVSAIPKFLIEQVDLIGGIDFIFIELVLSKSREERRNLYLVLFDYVSHLINEICVANGVSEYGYDEIQPIATSLVLADAPEAFYISVKLGVEGIGELLKRSIFAALSTYPNSDRLNTLLEKITEKLDAFISSFIHLDKEFAQMIQITKSLKSMESINGGVVRHTVNIKVAWPTLHSLLHSERLVCRQNGYVWLGDLLIAEINEERGANTWTNIKSLQQKVALAGINDYSADLDVPLPVWLMCGLLKSKHCIIRWGFLFVLERLLMRCKFLLDENELQHSSSTEAAGDLPDNNRLEKANAVIDIMSCALSLVAQMNETDRINILKMCDILFSQLCLKVSPATFGEAAQDRKVFRRMDGKKKSDIREFNQQDNFFWEEPADDAESRFCHTDGTPICETASMAALLLRGQAIVPMQLVARVPAALFYWPLIQLAGAATDNIALGVSVGSKGRGNLPGAASDIRATLLLLLIGKCTADPASFQEVGGEEFFRELLDDTDSRVAYYSSTFLLKRMMTEEPEKYQRMLQSLIFRAQQSNNEKLLENPYLQMRGILHLSNE